MILNNFTFGVTDMRRYCPLIAALLIVPCLVLFVSPSASAAGMEDINLAVNSKGDFLMLEYDYAKQNYSGVASKSFDVPNVHSLNGVLYGRFYASQNIKDLAFYFYADDMFQAEFQYVDGVVYFFCRINATALRYRQSCVVSVTGVNAFSDAYYLFDYIRFSTDFTGSDFESIVATSCKATLIPNSNPADITSTGRYTGDSWVEFDNTYFDDPNDTYNLWGKSASDLSAQVMCVRLLFTPTLEGGQHFRIPCLITGGSPIYVGVFDNAYNPLSFDLAIYNESVSQRSYSFCEGMRVLGEADLTSPGGTIEYEKFDIELVNVPTSVSALVDYSQAYQSSFFVEFDSDRPSVVEILFLKTAAYVSPSGTGSIPVGWAVSVDGACSFPVGSGSYLSSYDTSIDSSVVAFLRQLVAGVSDLNVDTTTITKLLTQLLTTNTNGFTDLNRSLIALWNVLQYINEDTTSMNDTLWLFYSMYKSDSAEEEEENEEIASSAAGFDSNVGSLDGFEGGYQSNISSNSGSVVSSVVSSFSSFVPALSFVSGYVQGAFVSLGSAGIIITLPIFLGIFCYLCSRAPGVTRTFINRHSSRSSRGSSRSRASSKNVDGGDTV